MECIKCGKPATKRYSPDLDIKGIGMCDEHKEEIRMDILVASFEGWDKFESKYFNKPKKKRIDDKKEYTLKDIALAFHQGFILGTKLEDDRELSEMPVLKACGISTEQYLDYLEKKTKR